MYKYKEISIFEYLKTRDEARFVTCDICDKNTNEMYWDSEEREHICHDCALKWKVEIEEKPTYNQLLEERNK